MNHYNGYTPQERNRKLRASYKVYPNRSHPYYAGPCHLCGDPNAAVEPHSEDYSEPYLWAKPAEYAVCKTCHSRLHKRFENPHAWTAYKLHIKRGGYGSDLKTSKIASEVRAAATVLAKEESVSLPALRPFTATELWWDRLTVDSAALTASWARPRP